MSYCRFSTDGHQCDVYVYESTDGYWMIPIRNMLS